MFGLKQKLTMLASLVFVLVLAACGGADASDDSEESYSEQMEFTITGLEPGAGQTGINNEAIEAYDSMDGWTQETSSTGAMLAALDAAIAKEEPIMITAWSPHYMFAKWDIKYLEDPLGVFGEELHAGTLSRLGFEEEMPLAYEVMKQFHWELEDVEAALFKAAEEGLPLEDAAQEWVDDNADIVASWTEGKDTVDGVALELGSTTWDDSLFTSNVAKIVLEQLGFNVRITPVDPAILFESLASGDSDVTLSPWLPTSHGALYEEYKGEFVDIGKNVEGAGIGLAVPSYMEIDSLEDLEPAK